MSPQSSVRPDASSLFPFSPQLRYYRGMSAISQHRKPVPREKKPGKFMVPKLVRLWPAELSAIEKAARSATPPVTSSRFIVEAALDRARRSA
jgi:hypothetical protein